MGLISADLLQSSATRGAVSATAELGEQRWTFAGRKYQGKPAKHAGEQ